MTKLKLVKILIKSEIMSRQTLVRLACENETDVYMEYLKQLKEQYMRYPLSQLEGLAREAQARLA